MPAIAFALYMLLSAPVNGTITATLDENGGSIAVRMRIYGAVFSHIETSAAKDLINAVMRFLSERADASKEQRRVLPAYLRVIRPKQIDVKMRIGLENAQATAAVVGSLRAAGAAVLSGLAHGAGYSAMILPDFTTRCFYFSARCMFSAKPGDIMLAALRAAVNKRGKR